MVFPIFRTPSLTFLLGYNKLFKRQKPSFSFRVQQLTPAGSRTYPATPPIAAHLTPSVP